MKSHQSNDKVAYLKSELRDKKSEHDVSIVFPATKDNSNARSELISAFNASLKPSFYLNEKKVNSRFKVNRRIRVNRRFFEIDPLNYKNSLLEHNKSLSEKDFILAVFNANDLSSYRSATSICTFYEKKFKQKLILVGVTNNKDEKLPSAEKLSEDSAEKFSEDHKIPFHLINIDSKTESIEFLEDICINALRNRKAIPDIPINIKSLNVNILTNTPGFSISNERKLVEISIHAGSYNQLKELVLINVNSFYIDSSKITKQAVSDKIQTMLKNTDILYVIDGIEDDVERSGSKLLRNINENLEKLTTNENLEKLTKLFPVSVTVIKYVNHVPEKTQETSTEKTAGELKFSYRSFNRVILPESIRTYINDDIAKQAIKIRTILGPSDEVLNSILMRAKNGIESSQCKGINKIGLPIITPAHIENWRKEFSILNTIKSIDAKRKRELHSNYTVQLEDTINKKTSTRNKETQAFYLELYKEANNWRSNINVNKIYSEFNLVLTFLQVNRQLEGKPNLPFELCYLIMEFLGIQAKNVVFNKAVSFFNGLCEKREIDQTKTTNKKNRI